MTLKDKRFLKQKERRKNNAFAAARQCAQILKSTDSTYFRISDSVREHWLEGNWTKISIGGMPLDLKMTPSKSLG